jgi:hypothetical protein
MSSVTALTVISFATVDIAVDEGFSLQAGMGR